MTEPTTPDEKPVIGDMTVNYELKTDGKVDLAALVDRAIEKSSFLDDLAAKYMDVPSSFTVTFGPLSEFEMKLINLIREQMRRIDGDDGPGAVPART